MSHRSSKGFTLIELVVVIMILGILATVAAPKLLGTSAAATDNGLKQMLLGARDSTPVYSLEENEKEQIQAALRATDGNKTRAAKMLGISRATIFRKIKEYGLS